MSADPKKILADALALPADARAGLAAQLIDSLDEEVDEDAEDAWSAELARRIEEIDSGAVKPIPWSEARRRILGRPRAPETR